MRHLRAVGSRIREALPYSVLLLHEFYIHVGLCSKRFLRFVTFLNSLKAFFYKKSSRPTLVISCIVCYVALPFNHTFKIGGQCIWTVKYRKKLCTLEEVALFSPLGKLAEKGYIYFANFFFCIFIFFNGRHSRPGSSETNGPIFTKISGLVDGYNQLIKLFSVSQGMLPRQPIKV